MTETAKIKDLLVEYTENVAKNVVKSNFDVLTEIVNLLILSKSNKTKVFTAGNGGSAATASHMANDLTKGARAHNRTGFNIECLADSLPVVTCLANDFSYDDIFSIQLETKAKPEDVLVVFSGSGNSPNIIKALEKANEMGLTTIGFSGGNGGKLKLLCDYSLISPTDNMEQLEDMHMIYEHAMVTVIRGILEDMWGMEIIKYPKPQHKFEFALFDFDGTISLIREGWQEIMIPYFVQELEKTGTKESLHTLNMIVTEFVDTLTGKQTIFQCMQLAEEIKKRGGKPQAPLAYKNEYLKRLNENIKDRVANLKSGANTDDYLVPGSVTLLKALNKAGIKCYLASGTDEEDVIREVTLLGLSKYFSGGIHGAHDSMITECSKALVINDILSSNKINGEKLVSFGDGFVEIELVANIGGYAVGVASDEVRRKGINSRKRARLIAAGADMIIPDFSDTNSIVDFLIRGD